MHKATVVTVLNITLLNTSVKIVRTGQKNKHVHICKKQYYFYSMIPYAMFV
jgi:hypothetical protein